MPCGRADGLAGACAADVHEERPILREPKAQLTGRPVNQDNFSRFLSGSLRGAVITPARAARRLHTARSAL